MNPLIFRAYDIRGVADTDLAPDIAVRIGKALGTMARREGQTTFAVGRDCRVSSPRVSADIVRGLVSTGLHVQDVGAVPTPLLYFATVTRALGGGVQVTGSHNPPEFNGLKMMMSGRTLHGDEIQELLRLVQTEDFEVGEGSVELAPIEDAYIDHVVENITMGPKKLRVVVDGGNGIGGPPAVRLFERLGCEVIGRYIEPTGPSPITTPTPPPSRRWPSCARPCSRRAPTSRSGSTATATGSASWTAPETSSGAIS